MRPTSNDLYNKDGRGFIKLCSYYPENLREFVFVNRAFISSNCFPIIWIYLIILIRDRMFGILGRVFISKAEELAIRARESISSYCYTECLAFCCRRGYLLLSEKEVALLCLDIKDLHIMPIDKRYIFNLSKGCPNLVEYKCKIHKNPDRPNVCKEFPLFIHYNTIILTEDCPAVKDNQLYPFLAEFKAMGFTLVYTSK